MVETLDLQGKMTQQQFACLVGVSQQAISQMVHRGVLQDGESAATWLRSYCEHLREMAAGRGGDAVGELATERARLAREQADKVAMQNAISRRELGPLSLLQNVLAQAGSRAGKLLDTIPAEIRRREPGVSAETIAAVSGIVASARNAVAKLTLAQLNAPLDDGDEVEE